MPTHFRFASFWFVLLVMIGAGLLVWSSTSPTHKSEPPRGDTAPLWIARAPGKDQLLRPIRRFTSSQQSGVAFEALFSALDNLLGRLESPMRVMGEGRLLRTLANGQLFDSRILLDLRVVDSDGEFTLQTSHTDGTQANFRGTLHAHRLVELHAGDGTRPLAAGLDSPAFQRLPIALGDLHIDDLHGVLGALTLGDIEVVGELATVGSLPLVAVDCRFPASTNSTSDYSTHGASAIVYLDRAHFVVRAVRVFDSADRQVREYSGFTYGDPNRMETLRTLHVRALASESETTFFVEKLDVT